ncbi:sigma-70 family RNA polymerase sigma factor [soil metagenome]
MAQAFYDLMAQMRPRLHRYCTRMVGSAFDGEDVLQEAMAKAAEAWTDEVERPESWLFAIAHNTALDTLRRNRRQAGRRSEADISSLPDGAATADARVAATASLATLMRLPSAQRSCVVLMDVLGHSAAETVEILGVSLPAVKAALHRGRARLQVLAQAPDAPAPRLDPDERARLQAYADRFNARDFDALRALLAQDVRLDLANRVKLAGAANVAVYFGRYAERPPWQVSVGFAEGCPALLFRDPADATRAVAHVVLLGWRDGQITAIRDFFYAPYVAEALEVAED